MPRRMRLAKFKCWVWNYQCWGSLTFWCGSGSGDPYFRLMDPDSSPTPDPIPFFSNFKDAKNYNIYYLQSKKLIFLLKFCVIFYFASIISVRSTPL